MHRAPLFIAMSLTRHIPNALTCLNLLSGCVACTMAFRHAYDGALVCILIAAVFDFLDGMAARLLHAHSPIGADLDSLSDDISFGLAPALVVYALFQDMPYPDDLPAGLAPILPYTAFIIAIFAALRLAKFNVDTRQTHHFIGLPVPANALFWAAIGSSLHNEAAQGTVHPLTLLVGVLALSWLMVSERSMFSLKLRNLSWRDNRTAYIFLAGCVLLLALFRVGGLALCIVWYILLSELTRRERRAKE